jgi:hydroxymethylbilane synthase
VKLKLGSRGSALALRQTDLVAQALGRHGVEVEVVQIRTSGDRLAQVALGDFGGKGLFVKEIEEALLDGRVDVGVHSLKDMPAASPAGLCLAAFPRREDPRDVFITRSGGETPDDLQPAAIVGTSSLRRRVLLLARRSDLRVEPIRGNVETRLAKLDSGDYDAIVLAHAGLVRLGLAPAHTCLLPVDDFVPAAGQGIIGLQAREHDRPTLEALAPLDDARTRREAEAERAFLHRLGAGCHTPVAGHARLDGDALSLTGLVASLDATEVLRSSMSGPASAPVALGEKVADELLARGAGRFLTVENA